MKKILTLILLIGFLLPSKIIKSCEKRINKVFQDSTSISRHIYKITDLDKSSYDVVRQNFFKDEVDVWIIDNHADSSRYYAILDNVIGKTMPISFLSIFNEDGSVYNVSVIKYREQYGGQIKSKRWLKKFENYTDTSNLIMKELNSKKFSKIQFSFLEERKRLGTAGSLSMLNNFSFENLLIMNSDVLTKLDLIKFINYYLEFEFDVLIGAATLNYNIPYGVIKDTQGKLIDIDEKPDQTLKVVSGIYLMKSSLIKYVKKNKYLDMPDFIKLLLRKKYNVGIFPIYEHWIDVGTHESLIRGKEIF